MKKSLFPVQTDIEKNLPYYIFSIGLDHIQEHVTRDQGYPHYLWIQTQSGIGRVLTGGKEMVVAQGQGVLLKPGEKHEYYADSTEDWVVDWVAFSGTSIESFFENNASTINKTGVYYVANSDRLRELMDEIITTTQVATPIKAMEVSTKAYSLLMQLSQLASVSKNKNLLNRYTRLEPVLSYIEEHYAEAVTLKELSELMGVTPQHLCTLFRKIMGTRIFEYINLVRIKKSKEFMLDQPDTAIRDVAHGNGFEDVSYFCYIFKRIEKTTPGDFKKLYTRS